MADHNYTSIERVSKNLKTQNAGHHLIQCDVTNPSEVRDLIQRADEFAVQTSETSLSHEQDIVPAATLLVNCAGITRDNWFSRMELDEWDNVLDVNLKGTFLTCRQFLDQKRVDKLFPKIQPG